MALKRWVFSEGNEDALNDLNSELQMGTLASSVLAARGFENANDASAFLDARLVYESPFALLDMDKAVKRITDAAQNGERIEIFGDYDVDGMTSAAILLDYLQSIGADAACSLPTRDGDGYGLNAESVERMRNDGVSLIITVDNGVSAHEAIALAKENGIDTVVCDHHVVPAKLPDAVAVVDPLREGDGSAFKELAGVGVVLKLIAALEDCTLEEIVEEYGELAALGTVSDVMPLRGENRYIVKRGIEQLHATQNCGIIALCEKAGVSLEKLDSRGVAFSLAPRLNAAGRVGDAATAFRLLITDDPEEAALIADRLEEMNALRQRTERETTDLIMREIKENPSLLSYPVLIFCGEGYNAGISGIVCSRFAEKYQKPTLIISLSGGVAKGSGRSVAGFSLYNAISACAECLTRFGGHDMAAGFTMEESRVGEFKSALYAYCGKTKPPVFSRLEVDCETEFSGVDELSVKSLARLAPFGCGNDEPLFATRDAVVTQIQPLGERHARITLAKNKAELNGAAFGKRPQELPFKVGDSVDAAYNLTIYESPKGSCISVKYRAFRPANLSDESLDSYEGYDAYRRGAGELSDVFCADRGDVAAVYRSVRDLPLLDDAPEAASFRFADMPLGRTAAALDILRELELIRASEMNGVSRLSAVSNPARRELTESNIYVSVCREEKK